MGESKAEGSSGASSFSTKALKQLKHFTQGHSKGTGRWRKKLLVIFVSVGIVGSEVILAPKFRHYAKKKRNACHYV